MPSRPTSIYSSGAAAYKNSFSEKINPIAGIPADVIEVSSEVLDRDESTELPESLSRPIERTSTVFTGLTTCLAIVLFLSFSISQLLVEITLDGTYQRLGRLICIPFLTCISIFFFQVIFTDLFHVRNGSWSL